MERKTKVLIQLICFLSLILSSSLAFAKDNTMHTVALGFQNHHGTGFQTHQAALAGPDALLSIKFAAASTVEIGALLGLSLTDHAFGLTLGGKGIYVLIPEEHLNVYLGATLYPTVGSLGLHRFDWFLGPGLAWYLPGARNLEIFAEFGFGGTIPLTREREDQIVAPRAIYLSTTGTMILGLHYWF